MECYVGLMSIWFYGRCNGCSSVNSPGNRINRNMVEIWHKNIERLCWQNVLLINLCLPLQEGVTAPVACRVFIRGLTKNDRVFLTESRNEANGKSSGPMQTPRAYLDYYIYVPFTESGRDALLIWGDRYDTNRWKPVRLCLSVQTWLPFCSTAKSKKKANPELRIIFYLALADCQEDGQIYSCSAYGFCRTFIRKKKRWLEWVTSRKQSEKIWGHRFSQTAPCRDAEHEKNAKPPLRLP